MLLSVHVLAAIVFIGPMTVAASLFPRYATASGPPGVARLLHRTTRAYAVLGLSVPAFGLALANELDVLTDVWLLTAIGLTLVAAVLLATVVLPGQNRMMAVRESGAAPAPGARRRLSMATGVFALLWSVVVLMVVRPGSTTGV